MCIGQTSPALTRADPPTPPPPPKKKKKIFFSVTRNPIAFFLGNLFINFRMFFLTKVLEYPVSSKICLRFSSLNSNLDKTGTKQKHQSLLHVYVFCFYTLHLMFIICQLGQICNLKVSDWKSLSKRQRRFLPYKNV